MPIFAFFLYIDGDLRLGYGASGSLAYERNCACNAKPRTTQAIIITAVRQGDALPRYLDLFYPGI